MKPLHLHRQSGVHLSSVTIRSYKQVSEVAAGTLKNTVLIKGARARCAH